MPLAEGRSFEKSAKLLEGAIDIHIHPGPHLVSSPRRLNPFEVATNARDAGMQAVVFMDVFEMSNGTAWLVNQEVPDFMTYGGIILNTIYGGINPRAVKTAICYGDGAKFVSFGTHSTYYQASHEGRIVDGNFQPLSKLYPKFEREELDRAIRIPRVEDPDEDLQEILDLIGNNPQVFMNTGHISVEEAIRLVELAPKFGINNVLVASTVTNLATNEELGYMAEKGALIEFTYGAYTHTTVIPKTHYYVEKEYSVIDDRPDTGCKPTLRSAFEQINILGPENCIISTDAGVYTLPEPVEALREFITCLVDLGISESEISMMVKTNPERLLKI